MSNLTKAYTILNTFIKNCDSYDDAVNKVKVELHGEYEEFTAKGLDGYMRYGNSELFVYVDGEEDPYVAFVGNHTDEFMFVWR